MIGVIILSNNSLFMFQIALDSALG